MTLADPVAALVVELGALEKAYTIGRHDRSVARRRADLIDGALAALWSRASPPPGSALVALGGYGRRLQLPRSDIDLLVLHDGRDADALERLTHALLYPLWNAGLDVGHAVRTPGECLEAAEERLDAWTAMLDGRWLAGDEDLVVRSLDPVRAVAARDPVAFAELLAQARVARRERFGSCGDLLEPHLKEGVGGLRDVATLGWLEHAIGGPLEAAGLLSPRERAAVDAAEDYLVRARSAVHLEGGRRADRLVVDLQPPIAEGFGFDDRPGLVAMDALMRALFEHARQVDLAVDLALGRARTSPPAGRTGDLDPAGVLAFLAGLTREEVVASASAMDAIAAAAVPDPVAWDDETRTAFLDLLRAGAPGVRTLELLDRLGLLARYLPCWRDVRCRPQRDPYHRFTVDVHLLRALEGVARRLLVEPGALDPVTRAHRAAVTRPDALLVGALLHDIGKVGGGGHVAAGGSIAASQLDAIGLPAADRDLAIFLVEEHLLLPDTATRRDLTDEDLLLDVAARIGTGERLAALALLAEADAEATGPAARTPWRRALLRELVTKVKRVFERGDMGLELAGRLADRVERVRSLLTDAPEADVDRFVLRMPRAYFLAIEPARAARHYRTIAPPLGAREVRSTSVRGTREGTYELLVVAADRPGLLSWIAGALAIGGISILSAQVFTTEERVAVDLFEVEGAFDPEITEARWRGFRTTLRRTIEGSISLERRVEDTRRRYPPPRASTPVTVQVDNDASEFSTVIEVGAPDRIGLLHDLTRILADLRVDVHLAKVATYDGRVVDAFYVRDALGRKIVDPAPLEEISRALRAGLGGDPTAP